MLDIESLLRHRGDEVFDRDGRKIGRLEEIYVDDDTDEPKWAFVHTGAFASRKAFVPLAGAGPAGSALRLAFTRDQVANAPGVADAAHLSLEEEAALYRHYGVAGEGRVERAPSEAPTDAAMTRSEEELQVEKARRATGRARLRKHVVTDHVTVTVPVQREEVRLEREPLDEGHAGAGAEADVGPAGGGLARPAAEAGGSEGQAEVVLHEEQLVIDKRVVPKERVRLVKDVVTDEEHVDDLVRKERIEIEGETS